MSRTYLDVPFSEKDDAKAAGAKWDANARCWFVTKVTPAVKRWAPLPDLLPGEDRTFGAGLFVDLVPSSCWFTNVRSCVTPEDWDRLRAMIYRRAGLRCEVCGAERDASRKNWLEAHERWEFDDRRKVQTLRRLICLCTDCHTATHYGFAEVRGLGEQARAHLARVTGLPLWAVQEHIDGAFELWSQRSTRTYKLDLSVLEKSGVTVVRPPRAEDRADIASRTLKEKH